MLIADWRRYRLYFKFEARTSRAVMHAKNTYFVRVRDTERPEIFGLGEVPLFAGLSREDDPGFEGRLEEACRNINSFDPSLPCDSSIRMGLETAVADLANGGRGIIFHGSQWLEGATGIDINGLIWMGDHDTMFRRIRKKLDEGFKCLKLKIGGIAFDDELNLLRHIRSRFPEDILQIRADANGAFSAENAMSRLEQLSQFGLHSIEQPVHAGQYDLMADICRNSPIQVALDEELIGDTPSNFKAQLLSFIRPQYVILKPALCGGFYGAQGWIDAAAELGIGWWATSALESNVGLNAITQWTAAKGVTMPQGLGTGELYLNNTASQLIRRGEKLFFNPLAERDNSLFNPVGTGK